VATHKLCNQMGLENPNFLSIEKTHKA